jgi:hypothetical protein
LTDSKWVQKSVRIHLPYSFLLFLKNLHCNPAYTASVFSGGRSRNWPHLLCHITIGTAGPVSRYVGCRYLGELFNLFQSTLRQFR